MVRRGQADGASFFENSYTESKLCQEKRGLSSSSSSSSNNNNENNKMNM